MNKYQELYRRKLKSPEEIAEYFKSGFTCFSPCSFGEPITIMNTVADYALKKELNKSSVTYVDF